MKTLGIDLRCLPTDGSAGGGIAHAARAVTKEIVRQSGVGATLYAPQGSMIEPMEGVRTVDLPDTRRASLVRALKEYPSDALFVPSGAVSPRLPVPAIPWVHDCDIFDHPEWFPQSWFKRQLTTRMFLKGIRRAPHVFAVSEYTKNAIERLVPSAKGRITVTGEGGDAELAAIHSDQLHAMKTVARSNITAHGITRRFVLILGTLEPRKNIPLICHLWSDIVKAYPDVDLVIAGHTGWKADRIMQAINGVTPPVVHLTDISDDLRRDLLLAADAVLVPSFSEGFGLVALEAIQAGTPVLASDRGALPEVVGSGEWTLDVEDQDAWGSTIIRVLTDVTFRERISQQQAARRGLFSWQQSAGLILKELKY